MNNEDALYFELDTLMFFNILDGMDVKTAESEARREYREMVKEVG
jgi:hypothetical protein